MAAHPQWQALRIGSPAGLRGVVEALQVGNAYVNRNQIGAVVGSQPFGGEGLSGTGPKAGGPEYLHRFAHQSLDVVAGEDTALDEAGIAAKLAQPHSKAAVLEQLLPGPTGESNRLTLMPRSPLLCLGPTPHAARAQAEAVRALGGYAIEAAGLAPDALTRLQGFSGALWWGDVVAGRKRAQALAARQGAILPLIGGMPDKGYVLLERHVCIDTTASGGNAQLLAEVSDT